MTSAERYYGNGLITIESVNVSNNQIEWIDSKELLVMMSTSPKNGLKVLDVSKNPLSDQKCPNQTFARLRRKGIMVRVDLESNVRKRSRNVTRKNGSRASSRVTDLLPTNGGPGSVESEEECNQWLSHEFRISVKAFLASSSSSSHPSAIFNCCHNHQMIVPILANFLLFVVLFFT
jgi:hypothetical protein